MLLSSSPLSSPPVSQPTASHAKKATNQARYRPARSLPFELAQHIHIYFEEQLYTQAFHFLTNLLSSGAASLEPSTPTFVPSSAHLALAATLAIHPIFTSRTTSADRWEQSHAALRLLRLTNKIVGPVNANFRRAFSFNRYDSISIHQSFFQRRGQDELDDGENDDSLSTTVQKINSPYADEQSIWTCAEDFWHVVGWALNCSCLSSTPLSTEHSNGHNIYELRWQYWNLWLDTIIQILEADWNVRCGSGKDVGNKPDDPKAAETSSLLLIYQIIQSAAGGHGKVRRIMRALFADGSTKSLNEFPAIFRNELKPPPRTDREKRNTKIRRRRAVANVNVDQDIYGDYVGVGDEEEEGSSEDSADSLEANNRTITGMPAAARTASSSTTTTTSRRRLRGTNKPSSNNSSHRVTPRTSSSNLRSDTNPAEHGSPSTVLGPPSSIHHRLRLMTLLSLFSHSLLPTTTTTTTTKSSSSLLFTDPDDLYTLFTEFVRPLPLATFRQFVLPTSTHVDRRVRETVTLLTETLLQRMLESSAPALQRDVLPEEPAGATATHDGTERDRRLSEISQCYLPYTASSGGVLDNAKVSLCLEGLVRGVLSNSSPAEADVGGSGMGHVQRKELADAVARGVERRLASVADGGGSGSGRKRRKKGGAATEEEEEEAWHWLVESGERMAELVR